MSLSNMKRKPAVAGQFYSGTASKLSIQVRQYIPVSPESVPEVSGPEKIIGMISPHAGLMYSGAVAGALYSRIEFPKTFILIGPNHTGLGRPVSIMSSGEWEIPTGVLKIDSALAEKIVHSSHRKMDPDESGEYLIEEDADAHLREHSLEVQLPFILYFSSDVMIVPITMMANSLEACKLIGDVLADAIKNAEYPVTIVASSDMTHYETDSAARAKDRKVINKILELDPEGLYKTVVREAISMCGFAPATAMLYAAQKLGAKKAALVKYMTSGDVSGDYGAVVGYAGIVIK